jgi:pyruvate/2-oxoacid:ferredoxin oxidoreductase beta subunit
MESQDEEIPKWANFICPSCGISYGINALIKAIRKRKQQKEEHAGTPIQT